MSASEPEWNATMHVLAAPALADKKAWLAGRIDFIRREIGWGEILSESEVWSRDQQILVLSAFALSAFALSGETQRAGGTFDLIYPITVLDGTGLRWLLEGIMLRRPELDPPRTAGQLLAGDRPSAGPPGGGGALMGGGGAR